MEENIIEFYKGELAKKDSIIADLTTQIRLKDTMIKFKTAVIAELKALVNESCDIGERLVKERSRY